MGPSYFEDAMPAGLGGALGDIDAPILEFGTGMLGDGDDFDKLIARFETEAEEARVKGLGVGE